jgi:predicted alpha/beta superfamily hydrolase
VKLCFAQKDGDDVIIGKYRVIHSHVLDEDRFLLIHLPREYGDTQLSYPALYLLYGQDINNYFAEAAIITEKLGSTGEIPPVIIIGVANTNRYRDILPAKIRGRSDSGGAYNFKAGTHGLSGIHCKSDFSHSQQRAGYDPLLWPLL